MNRYLVYCCAGTGGLFLTTVIAQVINLQVRSKFSATGNAHDMGNGVWRGARNVCLIGFHWDLNYCPGVPLYNSHVIPTDFIQKNPSIKLIKIHTDPEDYRKVAELYVCKAWPDLWTEEEYTKWASPEYPPYSKDNILTNELVRTDLINDLKITTVKKWHDDNAAIHADAIINFKTIMGIDTNNLVETVCKITGTVASADVNDYVAEYQRLNKLLYFKDYV